eukprot:evm.model.scf_2577.2 EVM.evm.TU.scf_2577.2   scf_2577:8719-11185(-)
MEGAHYVGRPTTRKTAFPRGGLPGTQIEEFGDGTAHPVDILDSGFSDTDSQEHGAQLQVPLDHQAEESWEGPSIHELTDGADALQMLQKRRRDEQLKGKGVQRQIMWWEQWLGVRIVLQKCIFWGNRIPSGSHHQPLATMQSGPGASMKLLTKECKSVLADLLDLDKELLMRCPHNTGVHNVARCPAIGCETELPDLWNCLSQQYDRWSDFKRSSLDRFHQQAFLQTGRSAQRGNLKVLQQGISTQIDNLLRIPNKLLQRSQLPWTGHPLMIGTQSATEQTDVENHSLSGLAIEGRDCDSFDDHDFYQQLLKELLEGKSGAGGAVNTVRKGHQRGAHTSNNTKDRTLRYCIQDKLVNFMVPDNSQPGPFVDQLTAHLFGQGAVSSLANVIKR